jgi:recombination protein RecA
MSHTETIRNKALNTTLTAIEKRWGAGAVMRLGDTTEQVVQTVSTGSLVLNDALGTGGWPRGRVVEVFGPESSGKTTLTLHAIAEFQKAGGLCAFIDAEHALDVSYARELGVDVDALLVAQPDCGEQALEITEALVRSGAIDLLVIDSVAALTPRAEIEGEMGDHHMGLQARLMSQALRKITGVANRTGTLVMFINQVRQKIGVTFGNGEVTTGGNALKFYSSMRVEIRRGKSIKHGDKFLGAEAKIKVVKNKLAPPFRTCIAEIRFGRGLCPAAEALRTAEENGTIVRSGSWFKMGEESLGQGKETLYQRLLDEPGLLARIATCASNPPIAEAK